MDYGDSGEVRAFKSEEEATAWAATVTDGLVWPNNADIKGTPERLWLVCFGDRGCISGFVGAFDSKKQAESLAKKLQKNDKEGMSYGEIEFVLETSSNSFARVD